VKLLPDANLSPRVADALRSANMDAAHVGDHQLLTASDDEIFDWAADQGYVVVTADPTSACFSPSDAPAAPRWFSCVTSLTKARTCMHDY
jgi:hypothetical protein